jgi:hypothetical protein
LGGIKVTLLASFLWSSNFRSLGNQTKPPGERRSSRPDLSVLFAFFGFLCPCDPTFFCPASHRITDYMQRFGRASFS